MPGMTGPVAVLGAGSWGTALAVLLAGNGCPVRLWGHEPEHVARLRADRENRELLPGVPFPAGLEPEADLAAALAFAPDLLVVVPSHAFAETLERMGALPPGARLAWATKGLEPRSAEPLHQVARARLGDAVPLAVVSGPTFAGEVVRRLPTAVTVASDDMGFARDLAARLHNETFRVYLSDDVVGVEVGGAVKNVMAIAAGIADGLGFGANTRAALITRGLAEISRLGMAAGGRAETFMGLAGLGDLVLTCTDDQSRNRRFGLALARGLDAEAAARAIGQVVEGVGTTHEVKRLAARLGVEMPITEQVHAVLFEGRSPEAAVRALLARADTHAEAPS